MVSSTKSKNSILVFIKKDRTATIEIEEGGFGGKANVMLTVAPRSTVIPPDTKEEVSTKTSNPKGLKAMYYLGMKHQNLIIRVGLAFTALMLIFWAALAIFLPGAIKNAVD